MPPRFHSLIATQFMSALADNALLVVAIALLQRTGQPAWWTPLLKFFFIVSYVALAPLVGTLADAVTKHRLMVWMNSVKLAGACALTLGAHPLVAFAVIGFGAAAYAPAKYGLITEWVGPSRLVAANAWIEVSVVGAVLLGTAAGGFLVSDAFVTHRAALGVDAWALRHGLDEMAGLAPSFAVVLTLYATSTLINLRLRGGSAAQRSLCLAAIHPVVLWREFDHANRTLWADAQGGRLSLAITTLFWGAAAVLQFAVLRWATDRLGLSLAGAAYLQAAVAVGLIAGASMAGRHVSLLNAPRVLLAGPLLGLLVACGPWVESAVTATALLMVVGVIGGLLMVPMNALLQHRGCQLLSSGRSIAVQGFNENVSVLALLAAYSATVRLEVAIVPLMTAFGLLIATAMALVAWSLRGNAPRRKRFGTAAQVLKGRNNSGL
ncbi:MAG TPA: lysophospholipid transporter LplT [Burkholderiaceae bacterium]|nr:lysophospholipid transporter LplT [Burkholderiaceae bacterium]